MPRRAAGLLIWRRGADGPQVLLAHPGGPYYARKDAGVWTIPKGELEGDEEPVAAALREFAEEMGSPPPPGERLPLGEAKQAGGKVNVVFATEGDFDADAIVSNTFEMPWPPRSNRIQTFPEIDRAAWFGLEDARVKLRSGQLTFLDRLVEQVES
jgi:predicted NUDIX family NTP pyrophosphohydrolase